jgi:hypothetical protein
LIAGLAPQASIGAHVETDERGKTSGAAISDSFMH